MNLYNGQITVAQLMQCEQALKLFRKEFSSVNEKMMMASKGMKLCQIISLAKGAGIEAEKIDRFLKELEKIK